LLVPEARVDELARMLGGAGVAARRHAAALLGC
jgi:DNA repair ATPase RecN